MITRADVDIRAQDPSRWGGPVITITVRPGLVPDQWYPIHEERTFRLRSTAGHPNIEEVEIHLDELNGDRSINWFGVFPTADMSEATDLTLGLLNDLAERADLRVRTAEARQHLELTLGRFQAALTDDTVRRYPREEWVAVRAAVHAVELLLSYPEGEEE
jgi:hypothetical protein